MPKDWCPFCPGSGKVPDDYEVMKYDNDFPALSQNPTAPEPQQFSIEGVYKAAEGYGKCEVILYSPDHNATLPDLSQEHVRKLVDLWVERFAELSADEKIKYIFIFENRGEMVGVTMPHPHGQIYGYSYIPKKLELELASCEEHFNTSGDCLICDMVNVEKAQDKRVIFENDSFIAFLPYFTEYPYGFYIVSKKHIQNIAELSDNERNELAQVLIDAAGTLDSLFGFQFPYMMCMHQGPVNSADTSAFYHFHIEYFPPMRASDKQKFNASSETGAWAHANPTNPEEKAEELRQAFDRFKAVER